MQRGLDVLKLPEPSFEATQKDARALRALRERLARIDPERLTHEEWLTREILDWQLATYASGADSFWDFFQVTPYSSPLRGSAAGLHRLHLPDREGPPPLSRSPEAVRAGRGTAPDQSGDPADEGNPDSQAGDRCRRRPDPVVRPAYREEPVRGGSRAAPEVLSRGGRGLPGEGAEIRRDPGQPRPGSARGRAGREGLPGRGARADGPRPVSGRHPGLRLRGAAQHHAGRPHSRGDPPARSRGGGAAQRPAGGAAQAGRLLGRPRGVPPVPQDRSPLLRQDSGGGLAAVAGPRAADRASCQGFLRPRAEGPLRRRAGWSRSSRER